MHHFRKKTLPVLALGAASGFLNGLLGAGGGILVVVGLRRFFANVPNQRTYFATAIAVMLPLSALSAFQYARAGHLPAHLPLWLILPAVAGGATGAILLRHLTPRLLNRIFSAVVLISGLLLVV